jgi:putative oxidoreductase
MGSGAAAIAVALFFGETSMTLTRSELAGRPRNALLLASRLLLAFIFVHEGVFLIFNFDSAASATSKMGVPNVVFVATIVLQLFAGMAIALGIFTRLGAIALAIFCFLTAFMFHTHFGVRDELLHFEKDLPIAGGLLVLALHGVGDWSIEAKLPRSFEFRWRHSQRLIGAPIQTK